MGKYTFFWDLNSRSPAELHRVKLKLYGELILHVLQLLVHCDLSVNRQTLVSSWAINNKVLKKTTLPSDIFSLY